MSVPQTRWFALLPVLFLFQLLSFAPAIGGDRNAVEGAGDSASEAVSSTAGAKPKANVILMVVDDQGFQAGCYGDQVVKTPNLDRLAASGTRFTRATCTTASCSASRSVLMTGLHNHSTGHYGHAHGYNHFATYDAVPSLPVLLAESGYRTCSVGKYHLAPEQTYRFETYANKGIAGARNSVAMARNAVEWMSQGDERPFFLYFCTSDPHRGGGPGNFANFNNQEENPYPGCDRVRYNPDDIIPPPWLPNNATVREELAEYYQAITRADQGLGVLLDWLQESGMTGTP